MELTVTLLCCLSPIVKTVVVPFPYERNICSCPNVSGILGIYFWLHAMPVTVLSLSMNCNYVCHPQMIGNVFPQQHACQMLLDSNIASAAFELFETNS